MISIFLSEKYFKIHFSTSIVAVAVSKVREIFLFNHTFSKSFKKYFIKK